MPNPPSISLSGGLAQFIAAIVTQNNVLPDGSNPGQLDTTTPLTFEGVQGLGTAVNAVEDGLTTDGRRIIRINPGPLAPGGTNQPWSFRVKASGRTAFFTVSGSTTPPPDVSGVAWDGNPPSPTPPT